MIDNFFTQSDIVELAGVNVHRVHTLPNGNIIVNTLTLKDAEQIPKFLDQWMVILAPGSALSTKSFHVVANFIPTEFNPMASSAHKLLWSDNAMILK